MPSIKIIGFLTAVGLFSSISAEAQNTKKERLKVNTIQLPSPPQGKGQIVFFRGSGSGMALGCSVNENGQKVSSLGEKRYYI